MKKTIFILFLISLFFINDIYAQEPGSGYCLNLDGANDWVELPNIPISDKTFTVEMWIDHDRAQDEYCFSKHSPLQENDFMLYSQNGQVGVYINSTVHIEGDVNYERKHVACVIEKTITQGTNQDITRVTIYVNGEFNWQYDFTVFLEDNNVADFWRIGCEFDGVGATPDDFFDGDIDEVRIWDDVRTQTEIKTNMCQKLIGTEADLLAYYRMDENTNGTATAVTDATANNYHGTLTNDDDDEWRLSAAPIGDVSTYNYASCNRTKL